MRPENLIVEVLFFWVYRILLYYCLSARMGRIQGVSTGSLALPHHCFLRLIDLFESQRVRESASIHWLTPKIAALAGAGQVKAREGYLGLSCGWQGSILGQLALLSQMH